MLTVGSLFSGIGGIDLGLRMTGGFETRWFCEVDPFCVRVLNKHWPGVPAYGDVRELRGSDTPAVDVLVGGFPCQPVSVAGQRKGDADDRWLWDEFARLIREIRPRWVLAENVTGLRSIDDGRLFGTVLRDLAACGYDAEWDCIPASAVGAHHQRDRVWIVAYPNGSGREERRWAVAVGPQQRSVERSGQESQVANTTSEGRGPTRPVFAGTESGAGPLSITARSSWWEPESPVCGVAHGIPRRVDRLRGLGNAVVPQVVELIGRRIIAAHEARDAARERLQT